MGIKVVRKAIDDFTKLEIAEDEAIIVRLTMTVEWPASDGDGDHQGEGEQGEGEQATPKTRGPVSYELYFMPDSLKAWDEALAPFISDAEVSDPAPAPATKAPAKAAVNPDTQAQREWWMGLSPRDRAVLSLPEPKEKGRIPQPVQDAWRDMLKARGEQVPASA